MPVGRREPESFLMSIAIDIGNSRIKWGVRDASGWAARGVLPTAEAARLAEIAQDWPDSTPVLACNVAGESVERLVETALQGRYALRWLRSGRASCGVVNSYEQPERLGADRWAAMIGARGRTECACLVVCAGTATTVDQLDAQGVFRGGLILPGFNLMRGALARNTAQLPLADGQYRDEPRSTVDAIVSGCLYAQLGAIERAFSRLASEPGAVCLMTGGAAARLSPHLSIPHQLVESLILDGLIRFGASQ